jgi:signal transduction protein with GAF and PtsI domain
MICVPLRTRKGFLGVLFALNKESCAYTERDERILEIISETIAVLLENAMLYGELEDHVHALEREKKILRTRFGARRNFAKASVRVPRCGGCLNSYGENSRYDHHGPHSGRDGNRQGTPRQSYPL